MRTYGPIALLLVSACATLESSPSLDLAAIEALDAVLRHAVSEEEVAGIVALVTSPDSILYLGTSGVMDAAGYEPMRGDALFHIASMTKPITSVGIMILVEQGRVALDEPASTYVPDLAAREVLVSLDAKDATVVTRPPSRPVTVRDLLRHTSGFGYTFSSPELLAWTDATGRRQEDQPLLHDPGARWTYGTSTYFVGLIIEAVSGEPLDQFLDARIFTPLGMSETRYGTARQAVSRRAALYRREDGGLRGTPRAESYPPNIRGDGGLVSTARDYGQFIRLILGEGEASGVRILDPESVGQMTRDQLPGFTVTEQPSAQPTRSEVFPLGAGQDGFGLGFQIDAQDNPSPRAAGSLSWAGIRNTHFWIDPENRLGVVLLTQLLPFYDDGAIEMLQDFERTLYEHVH